MNLFLSLYNVYNNCSEKIGLSSKSLQPIYHTTQTAGVTVYINGDGEFERAENVIFKKKKNIDELDDSIIIIPCTEDSCNRSGTKDSPHPLCDKLQYVSGDLEKYYTNGKKDEAGKVVNCNFNTYHKLLKEWTEHSNHVKLQAILKYVSKKNIIGDLISAKILDVKNENLVFYVDETITFPPKNAVKKVKDLFVRWVVNNHSDIDPNVDKCWLDMTLCESWIDFYVNKIDKTSPKGFCYITGEYSSLAESYPKKIRNTGDGAKLISSNAYNKKCKSGFFTFSGLFTKPSEVCSVSKDVIVKSFNSLRWLIDIYGYKKGDLAIVAWDNKGTKIPVINDYDFDDDLPFLNEKFLEKLKIRMLGYRKELGNTDNIHILGLDSISTGRLSISFYKELSCSDFLNKLEYWYKSMAVHTVRFIDDKDNKKKKHLINFIGVPLPVDIAYAAYGKNIKPKILTNTINKISQCMIEGVPFHWDLVKLITNRCYKNSFKYKEKYEFEKLLSLAIATYKKFIYDKTPIEERDYTMDLDVNNTNRDYLFGREFGVLDFIEEKVLRKRRIDRLTNARKLWSRFQIAPSTTFMNIWSTLERVGIFKNYYRNGEKYRILLDDINKLFVNDDSINNSPLTPEWLDGYLKQKRELYKEHNEEIAKWKEKNKKNIE